MLHKCDTPIDTFYIFSELHLVVAAQDAVDLVDIQLFKLLTCRSEIFPGVELLRVLDKYLTDSGRHGQTSVAVDIYLADS